MSNITINELIIAVVGYVTVFLALAALYGLFRLLPLIITMKTGRRKQLPDQEETDVKDQGVTGEETAAIAMALHLFYSEMHDEEGGVLTIKRVSKIYSPWSSKIYAVRNQFNRS